MKKKPKKKIVSSLLIATLLMSSPLNYITPIAHAETSQTEQTIQMNQVLEKIKASFSTDLKEKYETFAQKKLADLSLKEQYSYVVNYIDDANSENEFYYSVHFITNLTDDESKTSDKEKIVKSFISAVKGNSSLSNSKKNTILTYFFDRMGEKAIETKEKTNYEMMLLILNDQKDGTWKSYYKKTFQSLEKNIIPTLPPNSSRDISFKLTDSSEDKSKESDDSFFNDNNKDGQNIEKEIENLMKKNQSSYTKQKEIVEKALNGIKKLTDQEFYRAIHSILELPVKSKHEEDKYMYFDKLVTSIEKIKDEKQKNSIIEYFAKEAVVRAYEDKNDTSFTIALMAIELVEDEDLNNQLSTKMDKLIPSVYKDTDETGWIDWKDQDSDKYIDNIDPSETGDEYKPGYDEHSKIKGDYQYDPKKTKKLFPSWSLSGKEYHKVKKPKDWNEIYTPYTYISSDNNGFLPPDDPSFAGNSYLLETTYGRYLVSGKSNKVEYDESSLTIQYSFDKDQLTPSYIDTGIHLTKNNTLTYEKAKEALRQISVHASGKFVDDGNRVMGLVSGKIIVIENTGKEMDISSFIQLFEGTEVSVKALDSRSGETLDLTDLIETGEINSINVNGKEHPLSAHPIVDNSLVLFPIEDIAKALNGEFIKQGDQLSITINHNQFIYHINKDIITINDGNENLLVSTRYGKDGTLYANILPMLDALDYDLIVNSKESKVIIHSRD